MDLHETGRKILAQALRRNPDAAEVYLLSSRSTTIEVKKQKVDAFVEASSRGVGLRLFKDGRMGFSSATLSDGSEAASLVEKALSAAEHTEKDPFRVLPEPQPLSGTDLGIYDPALREATEEEKIFRAMALEKAALDTDERIKVVRKAGYQDAEFTVFLLNSGGADLSYRGTSSSASIMLMAGDGKDQQMGWDSDFSRAGAALDVAAIGERAARNALALLGAETAPTVKCPVLFTPLAAVSFLEVFVSAFSADAVQKGKSLLRDKKGKTVASKVVTLIDDGRLKGGLGTAPFDDEGVVTEEKHLIREGVLQGFLHNAYTAAKEGIPSTGNGVRGGYAGTPHVGPSNLFAAKGDHTRKQLRAGMKRGIEIMEIMGMHTANPISGEFSVGVSGLWIENGIPSHPVRGGTIAGNFMELLQKVEGAGDDLRFYGAVGSPSLLIEGLSVSGE